jgi:hypothetical protein
MKKLYTANEIGEIHCVTAQVIRKRAKARGVKAAATAAGAQLWTRSQITLLAKRPKVTR